MTATITLTRKAIPTQLTEFCDALGWTFATVAHRGGLAYSVNGGEPMTPGEAADAYLPGGFAGAYGGMGHSADVLATLAAIRDALTELRAAWPVMAAQCEAQQVFWTPAAPVFAEQAETFHRGLLELLAAL